jgi:replicative DNA helicase
MKVTSDQERDQLKSHLREYVEQITQPSQGANMYVCPLCGSGTGKKGTGAFSIDGERWHCFKCCAGGDLFDLIGKIKGTDNHGEQLRFARELFGGGEPQPRPARKTPEKKEPQEADYTAFFLEAHKRITETDYPQRRGLSQATVDRFSLGFVPEWVNPEKPGTPASPRLIIPTGRGSYLARDTRGTLGTLTEAQGRYSKLKVGKVSLFNIESLYVAEKPVFIVEGEIDAMSIIEVGGEAVALGSTSGVRAFIERLRTRRPKQPVIVALDNDDAGRTAAGTLEEGLKGLGVPFYRHNPAGQFKDPNEALQRDREAFRAAVEAGERLGEEEEQAKRDAYLKTSAGNRLIDFIDGITASVNTPCIPTGFDELDAALDGGLYEGLYIFGAVSSLGKTTLVTQIADQIAQAGTDVLVFSLEMARYEIMAKSISRHTFQAARRPGGYEEGAKTTRGITAGKRYTEYSQEEKNHIMAAIDEYGQYAGHIYINEGIGDIGAEEIRQTVRDHILFTGNTPVVVIDYLQIMAPNNDRATDKQNTDKAVLELKRLSRDIKTPVVAVSSFNRASYDAPVTMAAFKESGAIEYSSDVLIGLQFAGTGEEGFDADEARRNNPRKIELVILKSRNGRTGDKLGYYYHPLYNLFEETTS